MGSAISWCDIFRATFGTNVAERGRTNLSMHEGVCKSCREWADDHSAGVVITCVCASNLIRNLVSPDESRGLRIHLRQCQHCEDLYQEHLLSLLCDGTLGWTLREGISVRITDGPFENFCGEVIGISTEEALVSVWTNVFGRMTEVHVDPSKIALKE